MTYSLAASSFSAPSTVRTLVKFVRSSLKQPASLPVCSFAASLGDRIKRTGIAALLLLAVVSANAQIQVCQNMQVRGALNQEGARVTRPRSAVAREDSTSSSRTRARERQYIYHQHCLSAAGNSRVDAYGAACHQKRGKLNQPHRHSIHALKSYLLKPPTTTFIAVCCARLPRCLHTPTAWQGQGGRHHDDQAVLHGLQRLQLQEQHDRQLAPPL